MPAAQSNPQALQSSIDHWRFNMKILRSGIPVFVILINTVPATAHSADIEIDADRFYAGGGINRNEIDSESALGYQVFAGYQFATRFGDARPALEVGYWDSGDIDVSTPAGDREVNATGIWATGVIEVPLGDRFSLFGRAGYDFGDDDGLMGGGGLGYRFTENVSLRGEVVVRDDTDSLQANAVYWF
jgi:hypothetical protein